MRVHLPLQQGLRQAIPESKYLLRYRASASSITTRIKTLSLPPQTSPQWRVRVHLPLQQGLRHVHNTNPYFNLTSASASSITTRIKTSQATYQRTFSNLVRVHLPLQQGLRLSAPHLVFTLEDVRVHLPLQQGLRRFSTSFAVFAVICASASSITTRIKTFSLL